MITCLRHNAPVDALGAKRNRVLLIMLPGVGIAADEFAARGMVAELHGRGLAVDVIAAGPALELYLDGGIAAALHHAVIEPELAAGYARVWLLGISLGGMGALLYASAYERNVEGLILLAPFLGTQGTIAEMEKAGGLASWSDAGSTAVEPERRILLWLRNFLARQASLKLYLGYGQNDRFAPGHRMVAQCLPDNRVVTDMGGHDWDTWTALWRRVLDRQPFTMNSMADDRGAWR